VNKGIIMNIRRRMTLSASVLAAAAITGVALVAAGPANAATSNCASGAACIWKDSNYETGNNGAAVIGFQSYEANYGTVTYAQTSTTGNDNASSVYNNGNVDQARFYTDANYSGYYFTLNIKTGDGNLGNSDGNAGPGFNDALSSGRFI
jgi:hypothetical protein